MYKRVKKAKLGRKTAHRNALRHNLLRSLLERGHIETTSPKAKIVKSDMASLIEEGKKKSENLVFFRKLNVILGKPELVKKFLEYIKAEKTGTTIVKIGFRAGDNAEKSRVSLIGMEKKKTSKKDSIEKKDEKKAVKEIKKEDKRQLLGGDKKVDKTAVVKHSERARTRSGL